VTRCISRSCTSPPLVAVAASGADAARPKASLDEPDDAFVDAYLSHRSELLVWMERRTHDRPEAEDIVEEAFERLLLALRAGQGPGNPGAWLRTVASNLHVSRVRRARVARARTPRASSSEWFDPTADLVVAHQSIEGLVAAMAELSERQQRLVLMALQQSSAATMAAILGTRTGAARTRLHRVRAVLRARLEPTRTAQRRRRQRPEERPTSARRPMALPAGAVRPGHSEDGCCPRRE
jgi:RNA polymerase sigma-70 factor, ECF subfamily